MYDFDDTIPAFGFTLETHSNCYGILGPQTLKL